MAPIITAEPEHIETATRILRGTVEELAGKLERAEAERDQARAWARAWKRAAKEQRLNHHLWRESSFRACDVLIKRNDEIGRLREALIPFANHYQMVAVFEDAIPRKTMVEFAWLEAAQIALEGGSDDSRD